MNSSSELLRTFGQLEAQIVALTRSIRDLKDAMETVSDRVLELERQFSFWRGGVGGFFVFGAVIGAVIDYALRWILVK